MGFRPDIEGLRGLAVLLVVVFHAGLAAPGGFIGVDVFFVISGFLITGLLLREREKTGRIDLLAFYARRVRRLLPAALVVIAVTLPIAYNLYAPLDRAEVLLDGAASALSVGNIRFALAAGDYFSAITAPSPFLHFWSLGVEEQFYFVWPALLLLAAGGAVAARKVRLGVGSALALVFAASLGASVLLTEYAPNWAFYSLPTRAFELAGGGLLAVGAVALRRVPSVVLAPLGWLGLAAVVVSAFIFDAGLAFPGSAALIPTAGTMLLIAAGGRRFGPGALMSVQPMRFVGRISYSLYLWHWPIFVLSGLALGFHEPGLVGGLVLIGMSIAAATLSWAFVEEPFRRGLPAFASRPGRTVFAGVSAMLAVVLVANGMAFASQRALAEAVTGGQAEPVAGWQPPIDEEYFPPDDPLGEGDEPGEVDYTLPEVVLPDDEPGPGPTPTLPAEPDYPVSRTPRPGSTPSPTPPPTPKPTPKPTPGPTSTIVVLPPRPGEPLSDYALRPDVQPALADARNDKERIWFERCVAAEQQTEPRNCVYGNKTGSYTIALIGDSHGSHFFPAFEWVANKRDWRLQVFTKVSCSFVDLPLRSIILKREYTECAAWNEAVVARLNAAPPDLTVIAMSHWVYPLDPEQNNYTSESASMARMINRLPGKVVILADSPHSAMDVPSCLSANLSDVRACATARKRALSAHGVLERKAAEQAGVALIDLAARICTDAPCPAVVDNMIVYRDSHHLTATFSRSLGSDLDRLIDKVR